jgi:PBP1b-binding outer membrane lipoprotein LpoB
MTSLSRITRKHQASGLTACALSLALLFSACSGEQEPDATLPQEPAPLGTARQAEGVGVECDENLPSDSLTETPKSAKTR